MTMKFRPLCAARRWSLSNPVVRRVKVLASVLDGMLEHARQESPAECCGLLAGSQETITQMFRARNALASRREYFIAPQELIATLRTMRERGLEHFGIYHSHPHSENVPSDRDIELAYYPSCAYFIISPDNPSERAIRAFNIRADYATELEVERVL